ncbi:MAG TPA: class II glutamine amidotransferase [Candidatus Nanopelagicaceae bacterium]|nr:class II glutamine amidotransferase [Candidatus Nanopelagicaceae bacterium]
MCRLFAWSAATELTLDQAIGGDRHNLIKLSELHRDGWGMAWRDDDGSVRLIRDELPAFESGAFRNSATAVSSASAIVHLRWATEAMQVCIPNTHPFLKEGPAGEIAFAHNGGIPRGPNLDALIDSDLLADLEGETDSERYFAALISQARKSDGDLVVAFANTVHALETFDYSSINALALTSNHLYVLSQHRDDHRPKGTEANYYELKWASENGLTTAWSSGISDRQGHVLNSGSLLKIEIATGTSEVIDLDKV